MIAKAPQAPGLRSNEFQDAAVCSVNLRRLSAGQSMLAPGDGDQFVIHTVFAKLLSHQLGLLERDIRILGAMDE
jgi:hypothetical protein